ncbi:hypothetical protein C7C56_020110 [Massilia glaciei]|uniref:Uncharacterized protein n=2 Tax=Massilia glaciei TaxID=1524097 RepID=A0A2U2HGE3_9BURK|nr:hypothetical protein C7C56_020110 [Massilia glaciei]
MISGAIAMGSIVVSLFFLRYWRSSKDRFFLYFAASFALEAVTRVMLGLSSPESEGAPLFYLTRVVAYGLILIAIYEKNSGKKS